ncbi:MAG: protein phosphatase 2C domain-containing protein [Anaerolineales bacterium]|nr:protein phosphatase 2C domain-containing protein [Chloroflexota bacterium]MBL6980260.1 protein phosphatase 2C domain-containing protein [Anaerolineales bacterium]
MIPKEHAHLNISAITHEGMSGKNNEDRYGVSAYALDDAETTPSVFAIVADGIGGHQAGEIAAEIAVETISHIVAESNASDPTATLNDAVVQAGQAVHKQSSADAAQHGMGSTCVCTWIIGNRLYTATVGDSRIYLLREGRIRQISTDHTWIQEAIQYGIIKPEQARGHPQSHIIRRYLGSKKPSEVDFRLRLDPDETDEEAISNQGMALLPDDQLILCSDGLSDLVEDDEIKTAIERSGLEKGLQRLVDLANQRGGHDNITIVAIQIPNSKNKPEEDEPSSSSRTIWVVGAIIAVLAVVIIAVIAFFTWQLSRPDITPTQMPVETTPAVIETSIPTTDIVEEPTLEPPPTNSPPRATHTVWPTSTQSP